MTPSNNCEQCEEHKTTVMLVEQHRERISQVEDLTIDISKDISNLEGRVNMFINIMGVIFFLLCSMAFYGVIQIDKFKDLYMSNTIEINKTMEDLNSTVKISGERIKAIKGEVEELKEINNKQHNDRNDRFQYDNQGIKRN